MCQHFWLRRSGIAGLHRRLPWAVSLAAGLVIVSTGPVLAQGVAPATSDRMPLGITAAPEVISGYDSALTGAINMSQALGAYSFYNNGVIGQNTLSWVVDANYVWGGHEALANLGLTSGSSDAVTSVGAHATACAMLLGGRPAAPSLNASGQPSYSVLNTGIAWGTSLGSSAIATSINSDGSFEMSQQSVVSGYTVAASLADVISTSIGQSPDPAAIGTLGGLVDALARSHSHTTIVAAAGNAGEAATAADRMLGSPASGYNVISVGATGDFASASDYTSAASFSSRGPLTTQWYDGTTVYSAAGGSATRAGVDLVAPGVNLVSAAYVPGSNATNLYYLGLAGTSFATPLVAGGASLLVSEARSSALFSNSVDAATQSVVIKSTLLNSADKLAGWSNGQVLSAGVLTTTQGLDWTQGAGSLDLAKAYEQFSAGTRDVAGTASNLSAQVADSGWDYGAIDLGDTNRYALSGVPTAHQTLTVTLDWLRDRIWDDTLAGGTGDYRDLAQADLDLSVWNVSAGGAGTLVAQSISRVNTVEHLSFDLLSAGLYELRVGYNRNLFDLTADESYAAQDYGLSWAVGAPVVIAVPEPSSWAMLLGAAVTGGLAWRRRKGRGQKKSPREAYPLVQSMR